MRMTGTAWLAAIRESEAVCLCECVFCALSFYQDICMSMCVCVCSSESGEKSFFLLMC